MSLQLNFPTPDHFSSLIHVSDERYVVCNLVADNLRVITTPVLTRTDDCQLRDSNCPGSPVLILVKHVTQRETDLRTATALSRAKAAPWELCILHRCYDSLI